MINGFTVKNWKLRLARIPIEDSYRFDEKKGIAVVADGVTRDPFEKLPDRDTLVGKFSWAWYYQRPSPAKIVADAFCEQFIELISSYRKRSPEVIVKGFEFGNSLI